MAGTGPPVQVRPTSARPKSTGRTDWQDAHMSLSRTGDVFAGTRWSGNSTPAGSARCSSLSTPGCLVTTPSSCLRPSSATNRFVKRFEQEAELAAQLDHPNIVPVHDCGVHDGQLWISMRYIDGINAEKALEQAPGGMPPERAVRIVTKIAAALDYAHRHLLLRSDRKPANILLCAGADDGEQERVFLADFGIAKPIGGGPSVTATGDVLGTLDYVAPERIRGHQPDTRSDIYALGGVLYETPDRFRAVPGGDSRRSGLRAPGRSGAATERPGSVAASRAGRGGRHRDGQEARRPVPDLPGACPGRPARRCRPAGPTRPVTRPG